MLVTNDSFRHYMPATSKVLSIIDKGVQDRVTKNGECLRRHAEATQRWRNLGERIFRTEKEMEMIRKILLLQEGELDEFGSVSEHVLGNIEISQVASVSLNHEIET